MYCSGCGIGWPADGRAPPRSRRGFGAGRRLVGVSVGAATALAVGVASGGRLMRMRHPKPAGGTAVWLGRCAGAAAIVTAFVIASGRDLAVFSTCGLASAERIESSILQHPAALDADYTIWRALHDEYWPSVYIADRQGRIRFHHFGEGTYGDEVRVVSQGGRPSARITRHRNGALACAAVGIGHGGRAV